MTAHEAVVDEAAEVAANLPNQADAVPVSESYPVSKRFRKARRAACAVLGLALAIVGLLVVDILLTDPRRGATKPRDIELFFNRVRLFHMPTAPHTRLNGIVSVQLSDSIVLSDVCTLDTTTRTRDRMPPSIDGKPSNTVD